MVHGLYKCSTGVAISKNDTLTCSSSGRNPKVYAMNGFCRIQLLSKYFKRGISAMLASIKLSQMGHVCCFIKF